MDRRTRSEISFLTKSEALLLAESEKSFLRTLQEARNDYGDSKKWWTAPPESWQDDVWDADTPAGRLLEIYLGYNEYSPPVCDFAPWREEDWQKWAEIFQGLAEHPNTPPMLLVQLAPGHPEEFARHPATQTLAEKYPHCILWLPPYHFKDLLCSSELPESFVVMLSRKAQDKELKEAALAWLQNYRDETKRTRYRDSAPRISMPILPDSTIFGLIDARKAERIPGPSSEWSLVFYLAAWHYHSSSSVVMGSRRCEMPVGQADLYSLLEKVYPYRVITIKVAEDTEDVLRLSRITWFDPEAPRLKRIAAELQNPD